MEKNKKQTQYLILEMIKYQNLFKAYLDFNTNFLG